MTSHTRLLIYVAFINAAIQWGKTTDANRLLSLKCSDPIPIGKRFQQIVYHKFYVKHLIPKQATCVFYAQSITNVPRHQTRIKCLGTI